jgi:putative hemolysin
MVESAGAFAGAGMQSADRCERDRAGSGGCFMSVFTAVIIVVFLILANGVFSMAELAVVSVRRVRLQHLADSGNRRARTALTLKANHNQFFGTTQIAITFIMLLTGAFGEGTLSKYLTAHLTHVPHGEQIASAIIFIIISYFSLVVGELVPKRLGLSHALTISMTLAGPMRILSKIAYPAVRVLSLSTDGILRLLGIRQSSEPVVTEDEVRLLIAQGTEAGVFDNVERQLVESVFRLADYQVTAVMRPSVDIIWLDIEDPPEAILKKMLESGHSRFPVAQGQLDKMIGFVCAKDLVVQSMQGKSLDLNAAIRHPIQVPETLPAMKVLEQFKQSGTHIAVVVNEYGGVEGLVTANDILEAIVGELPTLDSHDQPEVLLTPEGTWIIDGMLAIEEVQHHLNVELHNEDGGYNTLSGFMMAQLARVPQNGDLVTWRGLEFKVKDMDGLRVNHVEIRRVAEPAPEKQHS